MNRGKREKFMVGFVDYMGLKLKNPVIVASGPWSRNAEGIQRAIDAGAAAVVTETISLEESFELSPRIYKQNGNLLNTTLYSPASFDCWEKEFSKIQKKGSYVIANIRGGSPTEFAYLASRMERLDADALELVPFTPSGFFMDGADDGPEVIVEVVRAVNRVVNIPVSIRLPFYLVQRRAYVRALEEAGIKAFGTTESLKALWGVDIKRCRIKGTTFGGYTGEYLRPIMLGAVSTLAQNTELPIAAMGGIRTAEHALEAVMAGASAVQLGSVVLTDGYPVIRKIVDQLEQWAQEESVRNWEEVRGAALGSLHAYEDIHMHPKHAALRSGEKISAEEIKRLESICFAGAIRPLEAGGAEIDAKRCDGCGLCHALAPDYIDLK